MANDLELKVRISAELADMKAAIAGLRKDFDSIGASAKSSSKSATEGMQGLSDGIDDIIASLRREADLFGKTSQEAKLYELALRGATQAEMAEARALTATIANLKNKAAAEQQATAAENNRQASIKRIVSGLNEEVAVLGKTSKELTLHKLQQLGASDATLKHVKALLEQKEAFERVNQSASGMNGTLKTLAASAAAFFTIQGGIQLTQSIAAITSEYQNMASRLRIATGEGEAFNRTQQALFGIAQNTSQEMGPLVGLYANIARSTKNLNGVTDEMKVRLTDVISKFAAISGGGPSVSAALEQLGQAMSGNFEAAGQELGSIVEQAPALGQAILDAFGAKSRKELLDFAQEGKLNLGTFVDAMIRMGDQADQQFGMMNDTVEKAMTRLKNDVTQAVGQADMQPLITAIDDLRATINDPSTQEGLQLLASGLTTVASWAIKAAAAFGDMGRELGYLAAYISGNTSELDDLEQKLKSVDRAANLGGLRKLFLDFRDDDTLQKIKEDLEGQRDALLVSQGGATAEEQAKRDAAAAEEKNRQLKAQAEALAAAEQAAAAKKRADEEAATAEEKRQKSIQGIIDNLTEQAATEGKSAEESVNYQLSQLGASEAEIQRAASLSQQIAAIKSKAEADKEAKKRAEEAAKADEKAAEARKKLLEDVAKDTEQVQVELLRIEGKGAEARTLEIERRYRDMIERMKDAGAQNSLALVQSLIDKQKVQAQFDDIKARFDKLLADLAAKEESLANRVRIGDITQAEADRQLEEERARIRGEAGGLTGQAQDLAAQNPGVEGLQEGADDMLLKQEQLKESASGLSLAYQNLSNDVTQLQNNFASDSFAALTDGISQAFADWASGSKTAKEAFDDMARGFAQALAKMAAELLAKKAMLALLDSFGGGAGSGLGSILAAGNHTGGVAGVNATFRRRVPAIMFAGAPRYHTGGVAGLKTGEIPAILQAGETIRTQDQEAALQQRMNGGGGTRVINVVDPNMVSDFMSSPQGEEVLLNVIQRNPGAVQQAQSR